jgi:phage-related protein
MINPLPAKPLVWMGSSRKDFSDFPVGVKAEMGYALYLAQLGRQHSRTKRLKGLGGGLVEVIANHHGDAFRTVYTVKFKDTVFVLHAFQKKSKSGIATPKADIDLVLQRLREAERTYEEMSR